MLDTGATTEFIDVNFVKRAKLVLNKSKSKIKLASGASVAAAGVTGDVPFSLERVGGGRVQFASRFEATELSGYDAILGMSWFEQARVQFAWDEEKPVQVVVRQRNANGWMRPHSLKLMAGGGGVEANAAGGSGFDNSGGGAAVMRRVGKVAGSEEEAAPVEVPRTVEEQAVYDRLVKEFADVFPKELPDGLPPRRFDHEHRIRLKPGSKTPYRRPYRSGPAELKLLKETLGEMMKKGFIKRSQSRYGAPVLFTPKKDGTMRMVIDYREINKITIKNGYPLPATEELFPIVQGAKYFSKIDLHSGYYQIRIAEEDREKTAFVTRYGSYEFLVLPMGLCNSPGTFMELMNFVFEQQLDRFVIVFLDDILVFSRSLQEHERHLGEVMKILREQKLFGKMPKCDLVRREVDFLGHRVGENGLSQETAKTKAVVEWPAPKSRIEVMQFLGLAGYYRKFVANFAATAAPLIRLTGSTVPFEWGGAEQAAFDALKAKLTMAPTLILPDTTKPYVIHTDASDEAIGAVLQQDHGAGLQPIGYMSMTRSAAQRNYATHEAEMLAIVEAMSHWRHLLSGRPVTVRSDHHSLQDFFTQRKLSKRQVRWMEELAEFDMEIHYVKGKQNGAADALSRKASAENPDTDGDVTFESMGWEESVVGDGGELSLRALRRRPRKQLSAGEEKKDREECKRAAEKNVELEDQPTGQVRDAGGSIQTPSQRCTANTARGGRCKATTRKGQYCWNHLRQQEGLRVKQSGLGRAAGMGLWAEKSFSPNQTICLYTGDWMAPGDDAGGNYALQLTRTRIIDAARVNAAPGRWANDPRGSGGRANARFSYNALRQMAMLKATRPIRKGEEVLVNYGGSYWKDWEAKSKATVMEQEREVIEINAVARIDLVNELLKECEKDAAYVSRRGELEEKEEMGMNIEGGLIREGGKIVIPDTDRARVLVLQECHDAPAAGHLGRDKTAARVKLRFKWEGVDQMVADYVRSCVICQQSKDSNQPPLGKSMPLPVPERPGQVIGIDFMGPFPTTTAGNDGIATIVCHQSKLKHLVACRLKMTAPQAARMVEREWVRLHGIPEVIVSDRDVRFTASFWKQFWAAWGTTLGMSTAYHPQTDGQTERENRTAAQVIRTMIDTSQKDWDLTLPMVELAINSAVQASTGVSPFMMNYGREASLPVDVQLRTQVAAATNPAAKEMAEKMRKVWEATKEKAEAAKARQKKAADKKRSEAEFKVGDKVLLSTANIQLIGSKELKRSVKFSAKFIGPFKVMAVVNQNAYKLELPESFKMHPTVNVSRLRRFVDGAAQFPDREVVDWRPTGEKVRDANGEMEYEVERVMAQRGARGRREYFIKWKGYPIYESTWEEESALENAQQALRRFRKEAEQRQEELAGIFKGLESETVVKPAKV